MKKTKLFLFAMACMCGFSALAQFSYGPKTGLNIANQTGEDVKNNKMLMGFNVGVLGNYAFGSVFSTQLEVLYDSKGAVYETTDEIGNILSANSSLNYISIPILAKATFGEEIKFFGEVGPNIGMLVGAKFDGDPDWTVGGETVKYKDSFKGADIGLLFGIGTLLPAGNMNLMIDLRYTMSLGTIREDMQVPIDYDPITGQITYETKTPDVSNTVISINIALLFGGPKEIQQ